MFGELHYWLIVSSKKDEFLKNINDEAFGPSTDFVVAISLRDDYFIMYDVYNLLKEHGTKVNVTFYGSWSKVNGLVVNLNESKIIRRSNMQGIVLRAALFKVFFCFIIHAK